MLMIAATACGAGADDVEGAGRDLDVETQALDDTRPPMIDGSGRIPYTRPTGEEQPGSTITNRYVCFQPMLTSTTTAPTADVALERDKLLERACGFVMGTFPRLLHEAASTAPLPMTGEMSYTADMLGALGGGAQCFPGLRVESDGQIAGVLVAMNRHEVEMSRLANRGVEEPRVRDYARLMILSHSLALKEQSVVLARIGERPEDSMATRHMLMGMMTWMSSLDVTFAPRLERAYMDKQVEMHLTGLQMIDAMRPQAEREEVRIMLEQARMATAEHLVFACEQRASVLGQMSLFDGQVTGGQGPITAPTTGH
jgi:uncharacterized protein (DUF305 family)